MQEVQVHSRINNMLKKVNLVETGGSNLELWSFDDALYAEPNGTIPVAVLEILMEWEHSLIHHNTIDRL